MRLHLGQDIVAFDFQELAGLADWCRTVVGFVANPPGVTTAQIRLSWPKPGDTDGVAAEVVSNLGSRIYNSHLPNGCSRVLWANILRDFLCALLNSSWEILPGIESGDGKVGDYVIHIKRK